jgi:hypothetical protein
MINSKARLSCRRFIVPVFVYLALSLFCCIAAMAEGSLNFDMPVPAGTNLEDAKELRMAGRQVETALYASDKSADAVAEYYRNFFQEQKFQKLIDKANIKTKRQNLRFKKDELLVSITITAGEDKTRIVTAKYLQPAGEPPLEEIKPSVKDTLFALPKQDVPGKDLADVPRPPESVRIASLGRGMNATIIYTTSLDVAAAADFYRQKMPQKQWAPVNEVSARKAVEAYEGATGKKGLGIQSPFSDGEDFQQIINDSYVLNFSADFGSCQITIFPNFLGRELGSMVQIAYSEKQ